MVWTCQGENFFLEDVTIELRLPDLEELSFLVDGWYRFVFFESVGGTLATCFSVFSGTFEVVGLLKSKFLLHLINIWNFDTKFRGEIGKKKMF